ncbi:PREDICTED: hemK methyltransferase family member 1 [Nanorana parkeri]|uniref:hemK methyltransferase family member 1 n=1 Tax=Nanorana parkeri TaxID=125878 RepID=UPI000854821D|nr:PREDICTED: hemK methyltransferase family member 1 [Nanorana parkeri]
MLGLVVLLPAFTCPCGNQFRRMPGPGTAVQYWPLRCSLHLPRNLILGALLDPPVSGCSAPPARCHPVLPSHWPSGPVTLRPARRDSDSWPLARHWRKVFQDGGIPEAKESSEILIAHALGAKTYRGLARRLARLPVSAGQLEHIAKMAQERLKRVPVQYIIGEWDFLDLTLQMRPPVFIPRPETEELVGLVLADCPQLRQSPEPRILEVGCGSGAVSLALLQNLPQARVLAVDKTKAAVDLTRDNAERLDLQHRIRILHHDILSDPAEHLLALGPVDVLVSNPPYIFTEDLSSLDPEIIR